MCPLLEGVAIRLHHLLVHLFRFDLAKLASLDLLALDNPTYWFALAWRRSAVGKTVLARTTLIKPLLATSYIH